MAHVSYFQTLLNFNCPLSLSPCHPPPFFFFFLFVFDKQRTSEPVPTENHSKSLSTASSQSVTPPLFSPPWVPHPFPLNSRPSERRALSWPRGGKMAEFIPCCVSDNTPGRETSCLRLQAEDSYPALSLSPPHQWRH